MNFIQSPCLQIYNVNNNKNKNNKNNEQTGKRIFSNEMKFVWLVGLNIQVLHSYVFQSYQSLEFHAIYDIILLQNIKYNYK